jgi:hypothetical protein
MPDLRRDGSLGGVGADRRRELDDAVAQLAEHLAADEPWTRTEHRIGAEHDPVVDRVDEEELLLAAQPVGDASSEVVGQLGAARRRLLASEKRCAPAGPEGGPGRLAETADASQSSAASNGPLDVSYRSRTA